MSETKDFARLDPQEIPRRLGRSITILNRQRKKYMGEHLRPFGFVGAMYMILLHIARNPGTSQDAIAAQMYIDKGNVTRRTKRLEDLGYIRRETSPTDRRKNSLFITDAGEALVPVIRKHLRAWAEGVTRDLNDDERIQLVSLLDRLIHTEVE